MKKKIMAVILAAIVCGGSFTAFAKSETTKPNPAIGSPDDKEIIEEVTEVEILYTEEDYKEIQKKQAELKKWYESLTDEQKIFVKQELEFERLEAEHKEQVKNYEESKALRSYLLKNLTKTQYSYIECSTSGLDVGVSDAKQIEKITKLSREYQQKNKVYITLNYHLSKYSASQLSKAASDLKKDAELKKLMGKVEYTVEIKKDMIELYIWGSKPKKFDSWFQNNKYADRVVIKDGQKANPQ